MKKLAFYFLLILTSMITTSFLTNQFTASELIGTKWISPLNDNCFDSLCFTSGNTVMYYRCDWNTSAEVGYKINGDRIEIEAYSKDYRDPGSKLILIEDDGVLRQPLNPNNNFPKNFIHVPTGGCN